MDRIILVPSIFEDRRSAGKRMIVWRILLSALVISWIPLLLSVLLDRADRAKGRSE
jgi:hypothetical protein